LIVFDVVLHRPEIAPNTGNLMRLSVNTGNDLHLVRPLGFELDDRKLRRAGLDYREYASVEVHDDFDSYLAATDPQRVVAFSQYAADLYTMFAFRSGDSLVFGRESDGLPTEVLEHPAVSVQLRIPIAPGGRSLNLANAAAVAVYEAWRQNDFRFDG
jgi:tRNA (cytidine/uridine-2'-O-)-methyltransferase